MPANTVKIGEAARRAELSVPAVRFYEHEGLLGAAPRSQGGYRLFSAADIQRLTFIRRARGLGLALPAVRELVRAAFEEPCRTFEPQLTSALDERIAGVMRQIDELGALLQQLSELRGHLDGDCQCDHPAGECSGCNLLGAAGGCSCAGEYLPAL